MPPKKGSKDFKSTRKPKVKKTVHVQQMSDSDDSESLLGPDRPSQRQVSKHKEGEEGEKLEGASERPAPEATQEDTDEDDRKTAHVSDGLSIDQEKDLVDLFAENPLFYDQTLKDFKNHAKSDHLLDTKGKDLGMSGERQF